MSDDILKGLEQEARIIQERMPATMSEHDIKNVAARLLVFSLEQFAVTHQGQFKTARSLKLDHGKLGWRKATSVKITKQTKAKEGTLSLIKRLFPPALRKVCVIVKESVNKDGLHPLTDEQLATVGAQRIVTDDFYAEPTSIKTADTTEEAGDV